MQPYDSVVRPLRRDTESPGLFLAGHPLAELSGELVMLRDWPRRTALIIAQQPNPEVPAALHRAGFSTAVAELANAADAAQALAPFAFLVVSQDSLADDDAVELIRAVARFAPTAQILLDCAVDTVESVVLVRALRAGVIDLVDANVPYAVDTAIDRGLVVSGAQRERVLAIGAHPDDVEIGCAGTLLDHRLRGDRLSILTLSRGATGGDQQQRMDESFATAEAIGAQLLFADLPDTQIEDNVTTIRIIESVVQALDPTVVYVHSKHDNHQDHRAVATAAARSTRGVRRVFAFQSPSATNDFQPTQFAAIDHVLQRKVQVLRMLDSQHGRSYLEPELVVAGSRYWARHLGANARYAEPFEVIRSVGDLRQNVIMPIGMRESQPAYVMPSYLSASPIRPDFGAASAR